MYTIIQAAKLIGVSRTTVYKYCKRDRNRYTSADSDTVILTEQGLNQLRMDIADNARASTASSDSQVDTAEQINTQAAEIERLTSRVLVLETQHQADIRLIDVLTENLADTKKALDQEQQLRLHEINKGSWLKRLFGK